MVSEAVALLKKPTATMAWLSLLLLLQITTHFFCASWKPRRYLNFQTRKELMEHCKKDTVYAMKIRNVNPDKDIGCCVHLPPKYRWDSELNKKTQVWCCADDNPNRICLTTDPKVKYGCADLRCMGDQGKDCPTKFVNLQTGLLYKNYHPDGHRCSTDGSSQDDGVCKTLGPDNHVCVGCRGQQKQCTPDPNNECCDSYCQFKPTSAQCIASTECSAASFCAGDSAQCPIPQLPANGTACQSLPGGICANGKCVDPCKQTDSPTYCGPYSECCDSACQFRPSNFTCREQNGCVRHATCTGNSSTCPPVTYMATGDMCDVNGTCQAVGGLLDESFACVHQDINSDSTSTTTFATLTANATSSGFKDGIDGGLASGNGNDGNIRPSVSGAQEASLSGLWGSTTGSNSENTGNVGSSVNNNNVTKDSNEMTGKQAGANEATNGDGRNNNDNNSASSASGIVQASSGGYYNASLANSGSTHTMCISSGRNKCSRWCSKTCDFYCRDKCAVKP